MVGTLPPPKMHAGAYMHTYFSAYDSKGSRDCHPNLVCGPQAERHLPQAAGSKVFQESYMTIFTF